MSKEILGKECKTVTHIPDRKKDYCVIKERTHFTDKSFEDNLIVATNFKRPFWTTKKSKRVHKDKRESESVNNVDQWWSTQNDLPKNIATKLEMVAPSYKKMRDVNKSPYVYGIDMGVEAFIKSEYQKKYPDINSDDIVCVLDLEADVDTGILSISGIVDRENAYVAVHSEFLEGINNPQEDLKKLYKEYFPDVKYKDTLNLNMEIFDTEIEMIQATFKKLHEWKPDRVAIWNMQYDIPKIINICKEAGVDPKDLFSDPKLPREVRYFKWQEGMKSFRKSSGQVDPIKPEHQWDTLYAPAYFTFVDAMRGYVQVRGGKAMKSESNGMGLDNILKINKLPAKLKFGDENKYIGADFHRYMAKYKKIEYIVYNIWDNVSILCLEDITGDIRTTMPLLSGISNYNIFNSEPKKVIDAYHVYSEKLNRVVGCKSSSPADDRSLGLDNWIATLSANRIRSKGMFLDPRMPNVRSNVRGHVYESDAVSSYPSNTVVANIGKDTTRREILEVFGIEKEVFKHQNINVMFGSVNDIQYGTTMMNKPTIKEVIERLKKL